MFELVYLISLHGNLFIETKMTTLGDVDIGLLVCFDGHHPLKW